MENKELILKINIKTYQNGIGAIMLTNIIKDINSRIFLAELDFFKILVNENIIPSFIGDACIHRLEKKRYNSQIIIKNIDKGSIIIEGTISGIILLTFKETIIEIIKEGFKESKFYTESKELIKNNLDKLYDNIFKKLKRKNHHSEEYSIKRENNKIEVDIIPQKEELISLKKELDKTNENEMEY